MSPEQARGLTLDRRADVWAAGVLAWEIVAGLPLWPRNQEDVSTLIKLVTEPPRTLRSVDPEISEALEQAVSKALAMDPNDRWPTAAAFAKALAAAAPRAEPEDVAEYVRKSAGPKIEQRREQIRAMGRLRAQIGENHRGIANDAERELPARAFCAACRTSAERADPARRGHDGGRLGGRLREPSGPASATIAGRS